MRHEPPPTTVNTMSPFASRRRERVARGGQQFGAAATSLHKRSLKNAEEEEASLHSLAHVVQGAQFRRPSDDYRSPANTKPKGSPLAGIFEARAKSKSHSAKSPSQSPPPHFQPASPTMSFEEEDEVWQNMSAGAHRERLEQWQTDEGGNSNGEPPPWFKPASPKIGFAEENQVWSSMLDQAEHLTL